MSETFISENVVKYKVKSKTEDIEERSIDPRTKLLILLFINITAFALSGIVQEALCISLICIVMLYQKKYMSCVKSIAAYVGVVLLISFILQFNNAIVAMLSIVFIMVRKMLPLFIFASFLISSTRVGEMIAALQNMNVHKNIIIPLVITVRFFPTLKEEFKCIMDAMKVRGINFSFANAVLHPMLLLENILIPMMLRLSIVADELSAAAVTRGIDSFRKRTSYYQVQFTFIDGLFVLAFFVFMVFVFIRRLGVGI